MSPHPSTDKTDTRTDTRRFLRQNTHGYLNTFARFTLPLLPKHDFSKLRIAFVHAGPVQVAEGWRNGLLDGQGSQALVAEIRPMEAGRVV